MVTSNTCVRRKLPNGSRQELVDGVWISLSAASRRRRVAAGLCAICPEKRHPESAYYCKAHHLKNRLRIRRRKGSAPQKSIKIIKTRRHSAEED